MPRGPMPKPRELRLLEGTHLDRINDREPIPIAAYPELPEGISDATREVWDFTCEQLKAMRTLAKCDRDSLIAYCEAVVNHRKASALLAKSDILLKGLHGGPIRNPVLTIQRDAATVIRGFAQDFGLTPASRTRIRVEEATAGVQPDDGQWNPFTGTGS